MRYYSDDRLVEWIDDFDYIHASIVADGSVASLRATQAFAHRYVRGNRR
jgi:hypothetical protein